GRQGRQARRLEPYTAMRGAWRLARNLQGEDWQWRGFSPGVQVHPAAARRHERAGAGRGCEERWRIHRRAAVAAQIRPLLHARLEQAIGGSAGLVDRGCECACWPWAWSGCSSENRAAGREGRGTITAD